MPIYFTVSELLELRNEELITKLREVGVLKSCSICIGCGKMLREVKYSRSIDKMAFRCYKRECDYFEKYISIRENSIFSQYKKNIYIILKAMYYWFRNIQMKIPEEELDISVSLVKKIYKDCRMFAYRMFYSNDYLLGGLGVICQIDESMFKYSTGRNITGVDLVQKTVGCLESLIPQLHWQNTMSKELRTVQKMY